MSSLGKLLFLLILFAPLANLSWAEDTTIGTIQTSDPGASSVTVRNANGTSQEETVGGALTADAHVITKPGQTVTLKLKDDSEITLAPSTDIAVTDYAPAQSTSAPHVHLDQGSAFFNVTKKTTTQNSFYIHTKSATMGVRGTQFVVDQLSSGYSTIHTLDGKVAIAKTQTDLDSPDKAVEVPAGRYSYLHPSMNAPKETQRFNRKTYLSALQKQYPAMTKQIRQSELAREKQQAEAERTSKAKRVETLKNSAETENADDAKKKRRKRE